MLNLKIAQTSAYNRKEIDSQKTTLWLPRGTVKKGDKLGVWD